MVSETVLAFRWKVLGALAVAGALGASWLIYSERDKLPAQLGGKEPKRFEKTASPAKPDEPRVKATDLRR